MSEQQPPSATALLITISPRGDAATFPVLAEAGDARAEASLELPEALIAMGERLLIPGGQVPTPDLEAIGRQLGRALFTPRLRGMLLEQARAAAQGGGRLQIQLQINVPELAALPWEWLAIGAGRPWVPALREEYPLVRVGRRARPPAPIVVEGPLRILAAGGGGQAEQLTRLALELAGAVRDRRVVIDRLPDADLATLVQALTRRQYHVLHLAAAASISDDERLLVDLGRGEDAFSLADMLGEYTTLRLITVAGAQGDLARLTAAPALLGAVLMGDSIPAAVSLGSAMPATLSARFAAELYDELAAGVPIDQAVTVARRALGEAQPPAWGIAQLRVVPGAGQLFALRPARPRLDARRLLPFALAATLLVALLFAGRAALRGNQPARPLEERITPDQTFVIPDQPAILPTATAAPPTPAPLPPPESYLAHTVALSETLALIAERYGSDPRGIAALNSLGDGEPRPGRALVVPVYRPGEAAPGGQLISRANPDSPAVALTFDIEIDQETLYAILEILRARKVQATFFVTGQWVAAYPDAARAIVRDGHELGNHSYTHPSFSRLTAEGAAVELDETERTVREITGATTRPHFRFPSGDSTFDMLALVARRGYIAYHWSTDDAGMPAWLAGAKADIGGARGAILLLHGRADTVAALPGWLDQLAALGLRPTTLSEALR